MVAIEKLSPVEIQVGPEDFRTQSQTCSGTHFVSVTHSSSVPGMQDRPVTRVEVKARTMEMKVREKFMVESELHSPHTCAENIH